MNTILFERFNKLQISTKDILKKLKKSETNQTTFIYDSHLEGLGTEDSDLDIYVLCEKIPDGDFAHEYEHFKVQITVINNMMLDIEYWNIQYITEIIEKLNTYQYTKLDTDELKLLHRLRISEIIDNESIGSEIKNSIENSKLQEQILKLYVLYANSDFEGAINMYNAKEYIPALKCARSSLENAIGALNAKNGITNLKPKWIPKIFINNNGYNEIMLNKYLKYQVYCNIDKNNIKSFVEEMLEFIQDILSQISTENISI